MQLTQEQKRILAQTLMGEARGEGFEGMAAVAHVIKNRASSGRYPNDPVSVALQPQQFSTWNEGEGGNNPGRFGPGSPGYSDAVRAVEAVFEGNHQDPTGGATHYWSPRGMRAAGDADGTPYWAPSEATQYGELTIGNHVYLPRSAPRTASQAAENVSYGNDLGQVPPPVPVPMPAGLRGTSDRPPREHNLSTIKFNSAPFANLPYPIEQASVQTDPRVSFHPVTMDRRYSPPASVPQSMFDTTFQRVSDAERMARDRLTQPQIRVASAPDIPMPRPRPTAPPRTTADEGLQSLIARRSEPSVLRRNEDKAERLMNVPTADQRLQSQINANPLGMGVATTAPFIPGEHWKPRPRTIPEAVPEAPISRRNEMRAEGLMDNPIPRAQAPVPAMAPANLRGDPLAHITPMSPAAPIPAPPYQRAPVPVSPIQRATTTKRAPLVGPNTGPVKSTVAAGPSPWGSQSTGGSSGSKVRLNSGSTANTGTYQGTNGYRYRVNNDGSVTNLDTGVTR